MTSRVVLAGNNLAAVSTLELLLQVCEPDEILALAPEPTRVAGWHASLEDAAREAGVTCIAPARVNEPDVVERISAHRAELLLSVYYTQIFSESIFQAVNGPLLNFHPSLLPLHRGTAPLIWAIIEGDALTGLTVHHLDSGVDTGNIVMQHALPIHVEDTGFQLHLKMAKLVRATAAELIRGWSNGQEIPPGRPQTGEATYHSSADPRVNHLDWSSGRTRIRNVVRALAPPLPGAFTLIDDEQLVITRVEPVEYAGLKKPKPSGMLEIRRDGVPIVWAGDGPLGIAGFLDQHGVRPGSELVERRRLVEGQILQ
jgi:methionyl-tRNA formyltransferase